MLSLPRDYVAYLESLLPTLSQVPNELPTRLATALQLQTENLDIELSEDSIEALLDALPMPQPDEAASITYLRNTLRSFLQNLRSQASQ